MPDADEPLRKAMARALDPYPETAAGPRGGVILRRADGVLPSADEVLNPANDATTTLSAGGTLAIERNGLRCVLPRSFRAMSLELEYEEGFPIVSILRGVIRPLLQVVLVENGGAAIHATTVEHRGRTIAVGGWSESGKTETALAFLEDGARFLSDKWTVLDADGRAATFPISVGVRRWALEALPRLSAELPRAARAQLGVARGASWLARPLTSRQPSGGLSGKAVGMLRTGLALGDRAAVGPSALARACGHELDPTHRPQLDVLVVLQTVTGGPPRVEEASREWAVQRMVQVAAYERRYLRQLLERASFASPNDRGDEWASLQHAEAAVLDRALRSVKILRVRAPFPTDPGPVASAIEKALDQ